MSDTDGKAEDNLFDDETDSPEPTGGPSYEEIPEHLRDEALDGHQIKKLAEQRIGEMQSEIDQLNDKVMRLAAELENTRRRAEREKGEAARYGITSFARDLLSVADNFSRAFDHAPEDPTAMDPEALRNFVNGIRMTEKELLTVFERNGVQRISPKGEKFDPNIHQAIAQVPGNGEPKDVVVDVAAPGFIIGDRVIRAAMVTVSTGENAGN